MNAVHARADGLAVGSRGRTVAEGIIRLVDCRLLRRRLRLVGRHNLADERNGHHADALATRTVAKVPGRLARVANAGRVQSAEIDGLIRSRRARLPLHRDHSGTRDGRRDGERAGKGGSETNGAGDHGSEARRSEAEQKALEACRGA